MLQFKSPASVSLPEKYEFPFRLFDPLDEITLNFICIMTIILTPLKGLKIIQIYGKMDEVAMRD